MTEQPVRVLVADDSEDDRLLLIRNLRTLPGFKVTGVTTNGVETIAWLNATPPYCNRGLYPYPELLLLDYKMPGYSGLDVLQWLHEQPRRPAVVLWSHTLNLIDQTKALELGAGLICSKPIRRSDLITILARVLPRGFTSAIASISPHARHTLKSS
jgi:CheY-like chemotaxis protein